MEGNREAPLVTVIIPARNEEDHIEETLRSVCSQDLTDLQIIVVDGSSEDQTPQLVQRHAERDSRIRLIINERGSIPTSLNMGLKHATGRWLVRVDAHSTIPNDYIRRSIDLFEQGTWGGVGGRKDAVGYTDAGKAIAVALASPFGVGRSLYHYSDERAEVDHVPFGTYPVELVRELGGWDERLEANEDYEFDFRVRQQGRRLLFDPSLKIAWRSKQSIPELFHQYRRYGNGKATVAIIHPSSMRPRHLGPPLLVAVLFFSAVLRRREPRLAVLTGGSYLLAVSLASISSLEKVDGKARLYLPLAFATMHLAWGYGFWEGLIRQLKHGSIEPPAGGESALHRASGLK